MKILKKISLKQISFVLMLILFFKKYVLIKQDVKAQIKTNDDQYVRNGLRQEDIRVEEFNKEINQEDYQRKNDENYEYFK